MQWAACKCLWSKFMESRHHENAQNGGLGRTSWSYVHVLF